jgi:hypothetical protein
VTLKARVLLYVSIVTGVYAIWTTLAPTLAARMVDRTPKLGNEGPRAARYLILVARGSEKMTASDSSAPHRNSPLALYARKQGTLFTKISQTWMARSHSTALYPPEPSDAETIKGYVTKHEKPYTFGYASVPDGLYDAEIRKSDEKLESLADIAVVPMNTISVRLSDYYTPNRIFLQESQFISIVDSSTNENSELVVGRKEYKADTYLHGTITQRWSHRDSWGCINLSQTARDGQLSSDWEEFVDFVLRQPEITKDHMLQLVVTESRASDDLLLPGEINVMIAIDNGRVRCDVRPIK